MQVVTPISLIIQALLTEIGARYEGSTFKFDPNLTYVEVVSGVRAIQHSFDIKKDQVFPLFAFSRTNLVPIQDPNLPRMLFPYEVNELEGTADTFRGRFCQFDLLFKLFTRDVLWMETFEVMYSNHVSINAIKEFTYDLPEIGNWTYQCKWGDLEESEYNKVDNFYQAVGFRATVYGTFMVTDSDAPLPVIEHIRARIMDFNAEYRWGNELVYSIADVDAGAL